MKNREESVTLASLRREWLSQGRKPLTLGDLDETLWPANTGTIYAIRSPSCKWYIGQTRQALRERWKQHHHPSRVQGGCRLIARACMKYGMDRMELWCLERYVPLCDLNDRERDYIAKHKTFDPNGMGYNLTPGGEESPMHIEEVAERSRQTHKEQWKDPQHRAKMSTAKRSSSKFQNHIKYMRSCKVKKDYWTFSRADALRLLKKARLTAIRDARRKGNMSPDLSEYDRQIEEHAARHHERFYAMSPAKAVATLKRNLLSAKRRHALKGGVLDNEAWYVEQIEAHKAREGANVHHGDFSHLRACQQAQVLVSTKQAMGTE